MKSSKVLSVMSIGIVAIGLLLMGSVAFSQLCPPGMISYWKFDEGSGTTAFDSINANHGTVHGATWTTGKVDGALAFDGVNDYVGLGSSTSLNLANITVEAWFKTASSKTQRIYRWRLYGLKLAMYLGKVYFTYDDIWGNVYYVGSTTVYNDGNWHHAAGTYDGSTLRFYVDGELVDSLFTIVPIYYGSGGAAIARDGNYPLHYFNGLIDEVAIYNRALTAGEAHQHYQNGLNGLGYCKIVIPATVDIEPDALNLKSNGQWITCYIELTEDYQVGDIDTGTVAISKINGEDLDPLLSREGPTEVGDYDSDGISDLMVKFDRQSLITFLEVGDYEDNMGAQGEDEVELTVVGDLTGGESFEGSGTIRVIAKGKFCSRARTRGRMNVMSQGAASMRVFALYQNYPNPFSSETEISFSIDQANEVNLTIYNDVGQVVRTLVDDIRNPGYYTVQWDGRDNGGKKVNAGIYFHKIQTGKYTEMKKMILIH